MTCQLSDLSSTYRGVKAPLAAKPSIHVLIPSSYAEDAPHLREKTLRIGFLFRAVNIFKVSHMIIYDEEPSTQSENAEFIKKLCVYMSTPPYLRRRLYKLSPELRFVGLLPPLNIPTHPPSPQPPSDGWELREALVERRGGLTVLHAGLKKPLITETPLKHGSIVTVLIRQQGKGIKFRIKRREKLPYYLGAKVSIHRGPLFNLVKRYNYSIATDKDGVNIQDISATLRQRLKVLDGSVCVAFGSYKRGLGEIAELQGTRLDELFNICVNFIPQQGVRSVRTEEAVYAVLSLVNYFIS